MRDAKHRITVRETPFDYYAVFHFPDGTIVLEPRELVAPLQVSERSFRDMEQAVNNLKKKKVSAPIDLKEFEE